MENLIYPNPSGITFDLSGWSDGDTMFKDCSVRVRGIPSTTRPIAAPQFTNVRQLMHFGGLNANFAVAVAGEYPGEAKTVTLKLFSFPVGYVEISLPGADASITWSVFTYSEGNELATELSLGKLKMASILEYEPIIRRLPGNVNTAEININIPSNAYANFTCDMHMRPVPGIVIDRH